MTRANHSPPDFKAFHQSIAAELESTKDRVRHLLQDRHWLTDGQHKEAVLRSVIRGHLPGSMMMGTGFVVAKDEVSTQIDILIIDGGVPVLFREEDLIIVTPDAVRAAIEVKTRLQGEQHRRALEKLGSIAAMCGRAGRDRIWTGLFIYEGSPLDDATILQALADAGRDTQGRVDSVSCGLSLFVRYWDDEPGTPQPMAEPFWRSYQIQDLAPSYFVGNLMAALASNTGHAHEYAWFPEIGGKEAYRRFQIRVGGEEPEACPGPEPQQTREHEQ